MIIYYMKNYIIIGYIILVFMKLIATCLTLGSGNSGGIFAPSLFMGAVAGGAYGYLVNLMFPEVTAGPGAYALVGMAAMVAGDAALQQRLADARPIEMMCHQMGDLGDRKHEDEVEEQLDERHRLIVRRDDR